MLTSLIRHAPAAPCWRAVCRLARALVVCALLPLVACATHPPATSLERSVSHALPADAATPLRTALAAPEAAHPEQSGFRLLADGATALQMRIALARAATKTLDMQYYIATEDTTGKLLLAAALYAADRGVRVRMLVDDLNFRDIDRVMAALNTHGNIEIRVFNPFGASQYGMVERTANFFTRLDSFTRRMHNKAMIADNQLAIVGGRNLGDEYFSASPTLQFRDLDVLAAGPVTNDISKSFDDYWASASSYPLRVLNHQRFDPKDLDAVRDELREHWRNNADPYNAKPLNATPLARQIARDELELVWAPAEFKVDAPDKIAQPTDTYVSPPMQRLADLTRGARTEFLAFSPYFVPHDAGVKILGDTAARGVRVAIVTNSLAATDAVAVQAGYAPYRVPLLQRGVELYEFKSQPEQPPARLFGSRSRASLHAKAYVIDRQIVVIGSLNLDPRSAHLNTELALVIHSPQLAQQAAAIFAHVTQPDQSYRVTLAPQPGGGPPALEWTGTDGGQTTTYHVDPHAGLLRNVMTGVFMLLPVDDQL
ncbi:MULTISPECIES: phospholipase D family protein [Burkholderia]|uniref:phospholipase D family protein n=1 Tax=Burkholderia TaxID=32008 RepID=UPI00025F0618|nr:MULTISPECIES: phospholipase D family protein [Burkholderia]AFJ86868.1 Cardiolipin synthetase [Burkholderia sp. KJ006]KVF30665.1 phospholipase [Burkholderia vietnamiensis]MBR8033897.1 phospholipase D family protein [Burkholderia vietnamiensis]MDN8110268.1 phospholipase D family protein [Burkholderia vietnamiensis]HDR8999607.1 phospholipase D family protein [Burkholderia vietnamiensis]